MKKYILKLSVLVLLTTTMAVGLSLWHMSHSQAAFTSNDLMDDNVMNNVNSMTATQIDAFLNNNFPSSCISSKNGFSANDPIGYNPSQGFIFGGRVSAGQVIFDAAQAYGLNPQVLITTLEKEENLVSGNAGCSTWRYASAVGFSCTDSGTNSHNYTYTNGSDSGTLPTPLYYINGSPQNSVSGSCVSSPLDAGFSEQLIWASWLLEKGLQRSEGNVNWAVIKPNWDNSDESNCYGGPMTQGDFKRCRTDSQPTPFDGYTTIDGQSVHMDNGATATLYWYTPHFSGNINFVAIFEGWFGPTKGSLVKAYGDNTVYLLSGTTAYPIYDNNILNDLYPLGPVRQTSAAEINNYTPGPTVARLFKDSGGTVYLVNSGIKLPFPNCNTVADYGLNCGNALTVSDSLINELYSGPSVTHLLKGVNGPSVYYIESGQKRPIPSWADALSFKISMNVLSDAYLNTIPDSPIVGYGPGSLVKTPNNSSVYVVKDSDNILPLSNFQYTQDLGLGTSVRTINSFYTVLGSDIRTKIQCGGADYIGTNGLTYLIPSAAILSAYGFSQSDFIDGGSACFNLPITSQPLDHFIRSNSGAIFYVTGGQKQYVTTYSVYQAHGGNSSNTVQASNLLLNMLVDGPPLTS